MIAQNNFYAELHLQPTASASEIRSAYRRAALLAHPDKGGSAAAFHSVAFAFEVLSCPTSRKLYDQAHALWLKKCRHTRRSKFPGMQNVKVPNLTAAHNGISSCRKQKREPASTPSAPKRQRTTSEPVQEVPLEAQSGGVAADEGGLHEGTETDHPAPKGHDTRPAMEHVRVALQDMTPRQRQAAIVDMPATVRKELLAYMSRYLSPHRANTAPDSKKNTQKCSVAWSRGTGVRTLKHIHKTSYQPQLRIRHLRMQIHAQADFDKAISLQMVLVDIRHAIEAAGDEIWDHPAHFCQVFDSVLESAGISQDRLGLSVMIFMRAEEWLGRLATIISPVMSLSDAVATHSRLLVARRASWEDLRAEWIHLMHQTQHAQAQEMTQAQAGAVADKARLAQLQHRMKQAIKSAERALSLQHQLQQKALKVQVQLRRQAIAKKKAAKKKAAAAAQKRAARKQSQEWAARRRWYTRADLTTDEMMQGPSLHL